jgi:putative transposase
MARKPRVHFAGAFYHVIARGNKGTRVFKTVQDYKLYLRFLREYKKRYPFLLYAYVLMPSHVHLLIEVLETPLSKIMQSLQFRYTRHYNLKYRTWGHLFQGRYKAILCEKDPYFLELFAYINLNPVRAGLGEDPLDYPWSSYQAYASGAVDDLLDQRALLAHFSKKSLKARRELVRFVKSRMGQGKREEFYRAKDQRFLGSEEFMEGIQGRLKDKESFRYQLSIPEIVAGVVSALGISRESIYSENRNREGSLGRGAVGYLARRLTGHSLKSVADHFGRDPVAISQGVGKLEMRFREDENLRNRITDLAEKLAKGGKRILI